MSDNPRLHSLLEANDRFYRVFEELDDAAMEDVWENSDRLFCVHPGWSPLHGWRPVLDSWKRIIENTTVIHFDLTNVQARVEGDLGIVTLFENIHSQVGQERHTSGAVSTNLFAYDTGANAWKLIHHHSSNAVVPDDPEFGPLN